MGVEWLLVASNAWFIKPSIRAHNREHSTYAVLYFLMIFASAFHHACLGGINCVFPPTIARKTDFFFAQLLVPMTALYLIQEPLKYAKVKRYVIWLFMVTLFSVEVFTDEPFLIQLIVVCASLVMLCAYWIIYALHASRCCSDSKPKRSCRFPPYDWYNLSMGFWLSILAVSLFGTQGHWPGGYDWIHSVWHILAAEGQDYFVQSRTPAPENAVVDAELVAIKNK